jgi:hypothetical protein
MVAFIEENYIQERNLSPALTVDCLRREYLNQGKLDAKSANGGLYPPLSSPSPTLTPPSPNPPLTRKVLISSTSQDLHTPKQITYDPASRKLYIADHKGMRILRCYHGSALETLIHTGNWRTDSSTDETGSSRVRWRLSRGDSMWVEFGC